MVEEIVLTYDNETASVQVASDGLTNRGLVAMTDGLIRTLCDKLDIDRDHALENFMGLADE
jgi:hypothetical protein